MIVTRMDLDGAGSPNALVAKILKAEPGLKPPIPIEELALQLDIKEIRPLAADGFEGGLITDTARSEGFILVNQSAALGRRRFTVGHELGHFLMIHHKPPPGGFRCSRADMLRLSAKDQDVYGRMEVEANQFSALMLMPPPIMRRFMERFREPDLADIGVVANAFAVSKEVAARNYAQFHEQLTAVVLVKDGRILRIYRHPNFPRLCVEPRGQVPAYTLFHRPGHQLNVPSVISEARAEVWLESDWGKPLPELCEQVYLQQGGFALIMLSAEVADVDDADDPDAELTSKQRFHERQSRWRS
jgi:Zn-dependent peptidase ImmA (M78 family)